MLIPCHQYQQPGFDLPRQQWSLLNHFCTEQGHCGVCRRKWQLTDTDLCPCGETQTMSLSPDKTEWQLISATLCGWRRCFVADQSSSSRVRVIYHNWSATKQRPHPQSVAEISRHSVLSGDRIRQCETSLWPVNHNWLTSYGSWHAYEKKKYQLAFGYFVISCTLRFG